MNIFETTPHSGLSSPVVFFGTEDFSAIALQALLDAGYPVVAVVTKPDTKKGRGHKLTSPRVKIIAQERGIPVLQPQKLTDITKDIKALDKPVGVLVSYGKIIPQSIIDLFSPGIINVHPSLLPKYRGPSPIESAIANGDQETGVTIMQLSARMDAGPTYAFAPLELTGRETKPELYQTLGDLGAQIVVATLPAIIAGTILPKPQDETQASYCALLQKSDALLQPTTMTAAEAERHVRAYIGFPKTKISLMGQESIITKAHVTDTQKTPLDIAFRDGAYLSIDELVAPSGKSMSAAAFLRGYAAA